MAKSLSLQAVNCAACATPLETTSTYCPSCGKQSFKSVQRNIWRATSNGIILAAIAFGALGLFSFIASGGLERPATAKSSTQ